MGYRLSSFLGGTFELNQPMISSAVVPGVIQVTPNGQTILLMRDAQTTGGYPRIGVVCHESLNEVAQLCPGDLIRFELVATKAQLTLVARLQVDDTVGQPKFNVRMSRFGDCPEQDHKWQLQSPSILNMKHGPPLLVDSDEFT